MKKTIAMLASALLASTALAQVASHPHSHSAYGNMDLLPGGDLNHNSAGVQRAPAMNDVARPGSQTIALPATDDRKWEQHPVSHSAYGDMDSLPRGTPVGGDGR